MTFQEHICDSRWGFTVLFKRTAKPQREGQKCLLEGTKMHFTLFLQWFSECPHKKYYKTVLIWAWARRGPKYVTKTVVWETRGVHTTVGSRFWAKSAPNASGDWGPVLNLGKQSVWATRAPRMSNGLSAGTGQEQRTGAEMTIVWQAKLPQIISI